MELVSDLVNKIQDYHFKAEYKRERNSVIKIKLQALHHLQTGKLLKDVAEIVLYDEKAVREWIRRFVKYDYEGLIDRPGRGQKPRLPVTEEENFKDALDDLYENKNGGRVTIKDIQKLLLEKYDCNYSEKGVYTLLDRINIVWITGRSKHPKHSQDAINQFKEQFPEEVEKIKEQVQKDKNEVWWQDESRVGR